MQNPLFSLGRSLLAVPLLLACSSSTTATGAAARKGVVTYSTPDDEIHTIDLGTGTDTKLLDGTEADRAPDGTILFIDDVDVGPPKKLSRAAADGGGKTALLTPGPTTAYFNPVVSPDGTMIAMTYYPRGFSHTLAREDGTVVLDAAGKVLENLAGVFDPSWLGDGRLVAAGTVHTPSGNGNAEPTDTPKAAGLFIVSADFATVTPLAIAGATAPMTPDASPDGSRVVFQENDHVFVVNIDGSGLRQLTTGDFHESYPAFSPDGKSIVVQSYGTYGGPKPYVALVVLSVDADAPITVTADSPALVHDAGGGTLSAIQHMRWR